MTDDTQLKTTEAQRRASKKYDQKNKDARKYRTAKSATKRFILNLSTNDDLQQVQEWLDERLNRSK